MIDKLDKKSFATLLVVSMMVLMLPAMASAATDWNQFHADDESTGYSTDKAPDTNNTLWTNTTANAVPGTSAIVHNGLVYINCGAYINKYDITDGSFEGRYPGPGTSLDSWATPCWAPVNDTIISPLTDSCNGGPLAVNISGNEYIIQSHFSDGIYTCTVNGNFAWNFSVDGSAQGTPAFDGEYFYLTSYKYNWATKAEAGNLYCVNLSGGQEWIHETDKPLCGSPALDTTRRNRVYVAAYTFNNSESGALYAINKGSGNEIWNRTISRTDSTPAIGDNGYVYVCGGYRGVEALKTYSFESDGTLRWETNTSDEIGDWTCSPAINDKKVIVGSSTTDTTTWGNYTWYNTGCNRTYALNMSTGTIIWSYPNGGCSPVVYNGTVITVGDDGAIYAFRDA